MKLFPSLLSPAFLTFPAAFALFPASVFAQVPPYLQTTSSANPIQTSTTGTSLSDASTVENGSDTVNVHYGAATVTLNQSVPTSGGGGNPSAKGIWDDVFTVNNPALTGQSGTARFTVHLTGGMQGSWSGGGHGDVYYEASVNGFTAKTYNGIIDSVNGFTGVPYSNARTFTIDEPFTYGTPFEVLFLVGISSGGVGGTATDPGSAVTSANFTLSCDGFKVLDDQLKAVPFTSTSQTGSAQVSIIPKGATLAGLTLTNQSPGHVGTTVSLLGGTAPAKQAVGVTFVAPPAPADVHLASDAVILTGTGNTTRVVQMDYNAALALALFVDEANLRLGSLDPTIGKWVNAVAANVSGTSHFVKRAYNPAIDLEPGICGLDLANHVAWAVINSTNTEFGVIINTPEIDVQQPGGSSLTDGIAKRSFGTVQVGMSGAAKTFRIVNKGTAKLIGLKITKTGTNQGNFIVTALGQNNLAIAGSATGTSTTFQVTFKPTSKGTKQDAFIHIVSNDADENPFDIQLSGEGAAP